MSQSATRFRRWRWSASGCSSSPPWCSPSRAGRRRCSVRRGALWFRSGGNQIRPLPTPQLSSRSSCCSRWKSIAGCAVPRHCRSARSARSSPTGRLEKSMRLQKPSRSSPPDRGHNAMVKLPPCRSAWHPGHQTRARQPAASRSVNVRLRATGAKAEPATQTSSIVHAVDRRNDKVVGHRCRMHHWPLKSCDDRLGAGVVGLVVEHGRGRYAR